MGTGIIIYDAGQQYVIDSDQIYVPTFENPKENKNDTESKEEKDN